MTAPTNPPPSPTSADVAAGRTLEGLRVLWAIRDARYARYWKRSMDDDTAAQVRDNRRREARRLPQAQQLIAWRMANEWRAPAVVTR